MASEIDICNIALGHLGDEAAVSSIAPPDGSAQAEHCKRFYPIARDELLARHAWSFATKRIDLAEISTDELPATWAYAYARPTKCLQAIAVQLPVIPSTLSSVTSWSSVSPVVNPLDDTETQDFIQESLQDGTLAIFSNVSPAVLRYVEQITDTSKFTPLFVLACARLLASYLAGPIIKGEAGMKVGQAQRAVFEKVDLLNATAADSRGRKQNVYKDFIPAGLKARA